MKNAKILRTITYGGKVMKPGEVHDLTVFPDYDQKHSEALVKHGHIAEDTSKAAPSVSVYAELDAKSLPELKIIIGEWNAAHPDKPIKLDLDKAKKSELVDAIAAAAGYAKRAS